MQHHCFSIDNAAHLAEVLDGETLGRALDGAGSVLAQVFLGEAALERLAPIVATLRARIEPVVIVGCTADGEICDGRIGQRSIVVSLAIFMHSQVHASLHRCTDGEEAESGAAIQRFVNRFADVRGLLLLVPTLHVNGARLLDAVSPQDGTLVVFGGGAAATGRNRQSLVFLGDEICENAVAAVALCGCNLQLECLTSLAWQALGPSLVLTDVDGLNVRRIDDRPALDVYRRYLGVSRDDDLFLLEFPFLAERHGMVLARNPVAVNNDDSLRLIADVYPGETVRLGYIDVDGILENAHRFQQRLNQFGAEAVFIYSCVCRHFTLQDDVQLETLPFQDIAATAGFFTHGEISQIDGRLLLHNSTQVVVGLREGADDRDRPVVAAERKAVEAPQRLRHLQMTSRLFNFITALTEDLERANQALQVQADCDALTGALNRRVFDARIEAEIARCQRHGGEISLALIDLDHFKQFNDRLGHLVGDYLLHALTRAIHTAMRPCDQFFRYGGEEFALVLPETTLAGAVIVAERLRQMIEQLRLHRGSLPLPAMTASFGVATYPDHALDPEGLIAAADAALYRAKAAGRNRIVAAGSGAFTPI